MKAKELLKWIVNNEVCTDSMGTVEVDEDFDFNGWARCLTRTLCVS